MPLKKDQPLPDLTLISKTDAGVVPVKTVSSRGPLVAARPGVGLRGIARRDGDHAAPPLVR